VDGKTFQAKIAPYFHPCKICKQPQGFCLKEPAKCKTPVMWGKTQHFFLCV